MQTISCYAGAASTVGVWRDAANAKTVAAPTLVLGVEACLKLRLWERTDDLTPYPIDRFAAVVSGDTLFAEAQLYSGEQTYSRQSNAPSITYEDPETGQEITTVARSWEYRLTWSGSYTRAGGSGTRREVHYEDGALVSDTTVDDPRAELFAQRRAYIQALPHAPGLTWNDLIIRGENAQTYSLG